MSLPETAYDQKPQIGACARWYDPAQAAPLRAGHKIELHDEIGVEVLGLASPRLSGR